MVADSFFVLSADVCVLHPRIRKNFFHGGTLPRVELEHTTDDMTRLSRQETEQSHRTLDLLLVDCRGIRVAIIRTFGGYLERFSP